ncbi:hypothetical protein MMC20_004291 [Loxospora ochrophaea]|nr:hypothetical protein [Loxospora ochrophaea]
MGKIVGKITRTRNHRQQWTIRRPGSCSSLRNVLSFIRSFTTIGISGSFESASAKSLSGVSTYSAYPRWSLQLFFLQICIPAISPPMDLSGETGLFMSDSGDENTASGMTPLPQGQNEETPAISPHRLLPEPSAASVGPQIINPILTRPFQSDTDQVMELIRQDNPDYTPNPFPELTENPFGFSCQKPVLFDCGVSKLDAMTAWVQDPIRLESQLQHLNWPEAPFRKNIGYERCWIPHHTEAVVRRHNWICPNCKSDHRVNLPIQKIQIVRKLVETNNLHMLWIIFETSKRNYRLEMHN